MVTNVNRGRFLVVGANLVLVMVDGNALLSFINVSFHVIRYLNFSIANYVNRMVFHDRVIAIFKVRVLD